MSEVDKKVRKELRPDALGSVWWSIATEEVTLSPESRGMLPNYNGMCTECVYL